jgi:hypothetical protein
VSVHLYVYVRDDRVPTKADWQARLDKANSGLVLDEFDPRDHAGFLPCLLGGAECGFEYDLTRADDLDAEVRTRVGDRNRTVMFVLHGGRAGDLKAAMYAAAALTEISDGVFLDPQSGTIATGHGVFELIRSAEDEARERGRHAAAKDAAITDARCPHCGAPCPSYRKTCKACGLVVRGGG